MMLTPDQQVVFEAIINFAKNPTRTHITVGGYAGTGKTTVTAHTVATLRSMGFNSLGFCCLTGKASSVLRGKLNKNNVLGNSYCGTIHSLIYDVRHDNRGRVIGFDRKPSIAERLLIVDEASMVNEDIWVDLLKYRAPIIAVGDHGQLEPIKRPDAPVFNLMENPEFRLEKIHRQSLESPILKLATMARESGVIPNGVYGYGVSCSYAKNAQVISEAFRYERLRTTLFLCARNLTRNGLNRSIRETLGYTTDQPQPGEKVICLKNNREIHIYNGVTGIVERCVVFDHLLYDMRVRMEDGVVFDGLVLREQFNAEQTIREHPQIKPNQMKDVNLFDFGYAITVHKAQGSEADSVILFMERMGKLTDDGWRRWLYTGITRAKTSLQIVNRLYAIKPPKENAPATA